MRARTKHILPVLAVAGAALAAGHVRLIYSGNGNVLFWSNPSNISIVINDQGSDNVTDGSDEAACRAAILSWNDVTNTTGTLVERTGAVQRARTDWESDSLHLILFDEDNSSGYFPNGSGVVALTPLTFFTSGQIIDGDVLFNGRTFGFTTEGTPGRFDIQDVAAHELGHLLGLDHSGWAGATMFPYVDPSVILHRSLSLDEIRGMRHMYSNGTFAQISGQLQRTSNGSNVLGAHIVAVNAAGRTAGATLSGAGGNFTLQALASGTYDIYAVPLDDPVSGANLTPGHTIQTNFEAKLLGTVVANAGSTAGMGTRTVDPDVALSLGRVADDYPLRVVIGQTVSRTVSGSGLVAGSTLTATDPALFITPVTWTGSSVTFNVTVPGGTSTGHVDLHATNPSGDMDILVAGLEITPSDPTVSTVSPATGSADGGYTVTLTGSGFRAGARVVVGNRVYSDGAGATVVNSTTLTFNAVSMNGGLHDVVVIDPSGVEGRKSDAFQAQANPVIASVFPGVGDSVGGTQVILTGNDFVPGAFVTIDGQLQGAVVNDQGKVTVTTSGGVPGGPYVLTIQNPGGENASAAFVYVAQADPNISAVSPGTGPAEGGQMITVSGSGFTANTNVLFGANTNTGAGGKSAAQVTFVDANTLHVLTPASNSTSGSVLVRDTVTQQAAATGGAYSFESSAGGGGGGGGCGSVVPGGPTTWRNMLSGGGWVLALFALLAWRRRPSVVAA